MTKARDIADFKFENIVDTGTEGTKVATGTTAQRGSTTGQFRFNSTTGKFEGRNSSAFISLESNPVVTSVNSSNITQKQIDDGFDLVLTGENYSSGDTVKFVANDNTEFVSPTTTVNSATQITARITPTIDPTKEPYAVKVISASGLTGSLASAFNIDSAPVWSTSAGNIGTVEENTSTNITVSASDTEGDTVSYAETGGTVLSSAGFSLNSSSGLISGTSPLVSGSATYSFNLRATSGTNFTDRTFNIIVTDPPTGGSILTYSHGGVNYKLHKFTSNGSFVLAGTKVVDIFMIGGGGGAGQHSGGGGGAGGLVWLPNQTLTSGTHSAVIGNGGANSGTNGGSGNVGSKGQDTTFSGKTAMGGGGGGYQGGSPSATVDGGCGGGSSRTQNSGGQSLQNSTYGYGQGFAGAGSGANNGAPNYASYAGGGTGQAGQIRTGGDGSSDFVNSSTAETTAFLFGAVAGTDSNNDATSGSSTGTLYIGGGGGGSDQDNISTYFSGGKGGGGRGNSNNNTPTGGKPNTGSGSGGQSYQNNTAHGHTGGSGIVIVRYTV